MADELDTETLAQDPNAETLPDAQGSGEPTPVRLSEEDFQRLGSWTGRMIADQIEKKVIPLINQPRGPLSGAGLPSIPQSLGDINNELQTMIFDGRVTEAFDKYVLLKNVETTQTTARKTADTRQALTTFSDKPDYKEIYPEMEKLALKYTSQGYPPGAAAQTAYFETRTQFLEGRLGESDSPRLSMSSSGTQRTSSKKVSLPDRFKKAAARDIAAGVFKDEADYIRHLSPDIRKQYGI